ncbi:MAG TPA: hypothetical protein VGJ81_13415 [Thermoanaerobaculia bacterium]
MRRKTFAALLPLLLSAAAVLADDPMNNTRGFSAAGAFAAGDGDVINIFNGNLTIPIATQSYPLNAGMSFSVHVVYTGIPWDFPTVTDGFLGVRRLPIPNRRSNAGLGWRVSIGRMISPNDGSNPSCPGMCTGGGSTLPSTWTYESPDGGDHIFYSTLHPNETADPNGKVFFTRDDTYLRLTLDSTAGTERIDFPDGSSQLFDDAGRLKQLQTPFDSSSSPSITVEYMSGYHASNVSPCPDLDADLCWKINDFTGDGSTPTRTHWVTFIDDSYSEPTGYTGTAYRANKIILAGVASGDSSCSSRPSSLTYQFQYANAGGSADQALATDSVACYERASTTPASYTVPLLQRIVMPDASAGSSAPNYSFSYYQNDYQQTTPQCSQGSLQQLTLPTLGAISYTYQNYFDSMVEGGMEGSGKPFTPGVKTRVRNGATWTYVPLATPSEFYLEPNCESPCDELPREFVVTVSKPESAPQKGDNMTEKYYFSVAKKWAAADGYISEEYGLPITHRAGTSFAPDTSLTYYLSSEIYSAAGNLLRTNYAVYERDADGPQSHSSNDNDPRVFASAVVFNDDDPCGTAAPCPKYITTWHPSTNASEGFDGLGHYRTTTTGDFGFTSSTTYQPSVRSSFTDFNAGSGKYVLNNTTPVTIPSTWILGTFSHHDATEGGVTIRGDTCFNSKGKPTRTRLRRKATETSVNDLVTDLTYSTDAASLGDVGSEKTYGGDSPGMTTDPGASLCTANSISGTPYAVGYLYQYGVRATAQYYDGITALSGTKFLDLTVDASGQVSSSSDSAGVSTGYCYDPLFRVTKVTHPSTADVTYTYTAASASVSPSVTEEQKNGGTTFLSRTYTYDPYGRLTKESHAMPSAQTATRTTTYDVFDRKLLVAEWDYSASPTHKTEFGYDPFGRVKSAALADGSVIGSTWTGVSTLTKSSSVATGSAPAFTTATTTETYDSAGRLVSVTEPNQTLTTYGYDVAGHLVQVCMNSTSSGCGQTRAFNYSYSSTTDGRGFLHSETHPENGTVSYTYDQKGHVLSKSFPSSAPQDLTFSYDKAERLMTVNGRSGTGSTYRMMKSFTYGGASGTSLGRLLTATRENYGVGDAGAQIEVQEAYGYDTAGRQNAKTTVIRNVTTSTILKTLSQGESFDLAGESTTINYPACDSGCGAPTFTSVAPTFTSGFLTGVTGYATFGYAASGMTTGVQHLHSDGSNGILDSYTPDSNGMPRPSSISFGSWSPCTGAAISTDVGDKTVNGGATASLSVSATGSSPVTYQWYDAGTTAPDPSNPTGAAIGGQTATTYTTPALTADHYYYVVVSNACKRLISHVAHITVNTCNAPAISSQASDSPVPYQGVAHLSVVATGSATLHYQWYRLTGGTSTAVGTDSSAFSSPSLTATARYWVRVSNTCGSATADSPVFVVAVVLPTPVTPAAAASDGTHISITWPASSGAVQYVLQRRESAAGYHNVAGDPLSTTSYVDTVSAGNSVYVYRVEATDGDASASAFSGPDAATTFSFSAITAGQTKIAYTNFDEVRTAINLLRTVAGSASVAWTDILPAGTTPPAVGGRILAQYLISLRSSMDAARSSLLLPALSYADQPVSAGTTILKAHMTRLQSGVQ